MGVAWCVNWGIDGCDGGACVAWVFAGGSGRAYGLGFARVWLWVCILRRRGLTSANPRWVAFIGTRLVRSICLSGRGDGQRAQSAIDSRLIYMWGFALRACMINRRLFDDVNATFDGRALFSHRLSESYHSSASTLGTMAGSLSIF